jgi:hypothetical protein
MQLPFTIQEIEQLESDANNMIAMGTSWKLKAARLRRIQGEVSTSPSSRKVIIPVKELAEFTSKRKNNVFLKSLKK